MSLKRLVPLNTVSLTANPSSAIAGDIYYNSTSSELRYYNGTNWIVLSGSINALVDAKSIYQDVRNQSGSSFSIATPVYISGSEGASGKMLISAASNVSEATSSKTMGLTTSAISNNSNGQVISEGILEGIDTTGAADGDPVWLGVNGAKIYGLANKPSAPAHLVFLGIVIRGGSATTGSIYVKIQNGFELQEIHNVEISSLINGNILAYDSTTQTWKNTNTLQSTSSTTPLVVKGTSSPSVNIFEVQNSDGYPMVFVDAYGALKAQASGMYVNSGYASGTGLVVRGYASQTADLQQWQNSAGTVLARVDANGAFYAGGISAYTNGNVSIGNTLSASYMQTVYTMNIATYASGPASQVPLTINGVSGQTGNLTEWKSDVGTVLARISNLGGLYVNSNISQNSSGRTFLGGTADHNAFLNVSIPTASRQGVVIRANASQTANLQEWQSSAGGVLSYISPAGSIFASNSGTRLSGVGGDLVVIPTSATVVPIVARGYASQTANLQEWQNSSGTALVNISSSGVLNTNANINLIGVSAGGLNRTIDYGNSYGAAALYLYNAGANARWGWGLNAGEMQFFATNDSVNNHFSWNRGGDFQAVGTNEIMRLTVGTGATSTLNLNTGGTAATGLVIKGAASQTADLQQWQDSSSTVLASINANGNLRGFAGLYGTNSAGTANYPLFVTNSVASTTVAVIKGATSQTASLQEWQDSAGTTLANISSTGRINAPQFGSVQSGKTYVNTGTSADNNSWTFVTNSASNKGIVIVGSSSQTANLQEWQNSAGIVVANIGVSSASFMGTSGSSIYNVGINAPANSNVMLTVGTTGWSQFNSSSQTAGIYTRHVNTGTGDMVGIYSQPVAGNSHAGIWSISAAVRSAGGASAVITNAYNFYAYSPTMSSGTITNLYGLFINTQKATNVTNAYGIYQAGVDDLNIINGRTTINAGSTTYVPLTIKAIASQTANLTEWQNSTGTVLSYVDASGSFYAGNSYFTSSNTYVAGTLSSSKYILGGDLSLIPVAGGQSAISSWWGLQLSGLRQSNVDYTPSNVGAADVAHVIMPLTQSAAIGLLIVGAGSQSGNLTEWRNNAGTTLASISASGSFTVPSLTVSGDFTVNGTTTNINTTNLVVEDKNITIADVSTPTDTTADGAGITIKGATDKTFNWVNSTKSFTSSEPLVINTNSTTTSNLILKAITSQTGNLTEWQNSSGSMVAKLYPYNTDSDYILYLNGSGNGAGSYSSLVIGGRWIRNEQRTSQSKFGVNTGEWHMASNPDTSAIAITDNQVGVFGNTANLTTFTVAGAASQTANLQEWQDSAGTILAKINTLGEIRSPLFGSTSTGKALLYTAASATGEFRIDTNTSTNKGLVVRGAASQTGNLQEWQNSANTAVAYITSAGSVRAPYLSDVAGTGSFIQMLQGGSVIVNTRTATNVGLVVFGINSQTANLQEWQNSSGTVLSSIDASGSFTSVSQPIQVAGSTYGFSKLITADLGATSYWKIATLPSSNLGTYDQINIDAMLGGWASTGKTRYEIMLGNRDAFAYKYTKFGDGLTQARIQSYVEADGSVSVYLYSENTFTTLSYNITLSTAGVANGATIYKNPTASTTAPTGTKVFDTGEPATYIPLINMNNAGLLSAKNGAFTSTSTSAVTLTVQSAASQTANIQEWKNNAGTTAYLNTNLQYYNPGRISVLDTNFSAILSIFSGNPAATVSIFRGAASQTADLAQWQNSSGTTYLNVTNAGTMISNGGVTIASNPTINAYGAAMKIASGVSSYPMLILQAAASQTADIQQWQNSAGTILTRIGSDGAIYRGATTIDSYGAIYTTETIAIGANNTQRFASGGMTIINRELASSIIFGVKGIASQTGDLTQWRNSSDTVLAKVDANGNFSAISKSFDIPHPTKENMRLRYASLEGNEHGVYVRGITKDKIIELPDYWLNLVNENSITVHLTPIGKPSKIYVKKIEGNKVYLGGRLKEAAYIIYAERKDIDKLVVEY